MGRKMKILGLIPCRGGSKGLPRKNLALLAGRPLLAWTIQQAKAASCLDRLIVSTEDEEIAQAALKWGAEVPFRRPVELASDEASPVDVAIHALDWLERNEAYRPEWLMLLQVTSPLREPADLRAAVALAEKNQAEAVVSVCPAPVHPFYCRRISPEGRIEDLFPGLKEFERRQELPEAYAINGAIYLVQEDVLRRKRSFHPEGALAYLMPPERSLDIDTPWELYLTDLVLKDRLKLSEPRP